MRYIDADKLKELFPDDGEGSWTYNVTAKSYIDSQPTADVRENVRGEWGLNGECPFCGYLRQWEEDNYCGNCGADMRVVEPQLPPLDIRDCDHCKHYVTRDGQTGCEKWECEFERR